MRQRLLEKLAEKNENFFEGGMNIYGEWCSEVWEHGLGGIIQTM
jgi:hypothetical protein